MALDSPYIGHVVRETFDKIVVLEKEMTGMIYLNLKYKQLEEMC